MGRRVRRTADSNLKEGGRRAGGLPKQTKNGQIRRPFESARWSCSKNSMLANFNVSKGFCYQMGKY